VARAARRPRSTQADLPADFAEALSKDPAARQFFQGLSSSQEKWHVQPVESARTRKPADGASASPLSC
jgi:uncharacterized protein YdeI (YjbR/CyaY-like superfamily)